MASNFMGLSDSIYGDSYFKHSSLSTSLLEDYILIIIS